MTLKKKEQTIWVFFDKNNTKTQWRSIILIIKDHKKYKKHQSNKIIKLNQGRQTQIILQSFALESRKIS